MSYDPNRLNDDNSPTKPGWKSFFGTRTRLLKTVVPVVILMVAILISVWMMGSKPKAITRPKVRNATLVEVMPAVFAPATTEVQAIGVVKPSLMVELHPQVGGEITKISSNFLPGGKIRSGEMILQIDPSDYKIAIRQRESDVARTAAELQLEQGNQMIARKELELLNEQVSPEEESLMLRQPQLESSKASHESALAHLDQAKTDLARTRITAPFNAIVDSRNVNLGSRVTPSTLLATLVGTDNYWVEVSVPVSQLKWIVLPQAKKDPGSSVRIFDSSAWGDEVYRDGAVTGLAAAVEKQGRMAKLLVNVPDPLAQTTQNRGKPVILLDTSVQVFIEGKPLQNVVAIKRQYLRDNDTLWIMDEQSKLDIRPVNIVFRDREHVYLSGGIEPNEKIITSSLPAPVQGMMLRHDQDTAPEQAAPTTNSPPGSATR